MTAEDGCGFFGREQLNYFEESSLHTTDTCFAPCPQQFCECFVNKRPITMLVEAGLDRKRLEVQKAHNRRHAKDFPVLSGFFRLSGSESLPLRQIFYAFISYHLQRNSELKGSAYGFQGISSEPRY